MAKLPHKASAHDLQLKQRGDKGQISEVSLSPSQGTPLVFVLDARFTIADRTPGATAII